MEALLKELEEVLPRVKWKKVDGPTDHDATFIEGNGDGWKFTLCSFDIENQGFPKGARGYDGAAAKVSTVIRLTRELAEKAFKLAEGST